MCFRKQTCSRHASEFVSPTTNIPYFPSPSSDFSFTRSNLFLQTLSRSLHNPSRTFFSPPHPPSQIPRHAILNCHPRRPCGLLWSSSPRHLGVKQPRLQELCRCQCNLLHRLSHQQHHFFRSRRSVQRSIIYQLRRSQRDLLPRVCPLQCQHCRWLRPHQC